MMGSKANFDQSEGRKVTNKNQRMRSRIIGIRFSVNLTWINAPRLPTCRSPILSDDIQCSNSCWFREYF